MVCIVAGMAFIVEPNRAHTGAVCAKNVVRQVIANMDGAVCWYAGLREYCGEHLLIGLTGTDVCATDRTGKKATNAHALNIGIAVG